MDELPILEQNIPLDQSLLWELQLNTYREHGPECWTKLGVPFHISSNAYTAYYFAKLIEPFDNPTILELGAGTGRFTYMLLKELGKVNYFMSDISEKNIAFWKTNAFLEERTQMCLYNPLTDPAPCKPDIVIANYVFDALPQKLYRAADQAYEGRVTLKGKPNIDDLELSFSYHPTTDVPYYKGTYPYPTGALKVFEQFPDALFIVGDKGMWQDLHEPNFNQHGTFSLPVNFHALDHHMPYSICPKKPDPRYDVGLFSNHPIPLYDVYESLTPVQCQVDQFMQPTLEALEQMRYDPMVYLMQTQKLHDAQMEKVRARIYPISDHERMLFSLLEKK